MIDKRLFESLYLAIPLKNNEESLLNPQPNWFVIDEVFGKRIENLPTLGNTVCAHAAFKLVFREILPEAIELGRQEEIREIPFDKGYQMLPLNIIPALASHETLYAYKDNVNYLLSLFQFRGILHNHLLQIDDELLLEIITPEPTPTMTPSITPSGTPEPTPTMTPSGSI